MKKLNPVQQAVGRLAAASRNVRIKPGELEAARQALQEVKLEREIRRVLHPDPPYEPLPLDSRIRLGQFLINGDD
jgi:multidrug efflux pump subunit AcrA (membrane-fusion protein)